MKSARQTNLTLHIPLAYDISLSLVTSFARALRAASKVPSAMTYPLALPRGSKPAPLGDGQEAQPQAQQHQHQESRRVFLLSLRPRL